MFRLLARCVDPFRDEVAGGEVAAPPATVPRYLWRALRPLRAVVAASVAEAGFDDLDAPIRRLHGAFTPTPYSPPLEKAV